MLGGEEIFQTERSVVEAGPEVSFVANLWWKVEEAERRLMSPV